MIQVIPFKRSEVYAKSRDRQATFEEWDYEMREQDLVAGQWSWYRENVVEKKITLEK